jgi:hypothetical protein
MKNVFIFVPAFGQQISASTFMTTHNLVQVLSSRSIGGSVSTLSFPDIAELRSMAFTIWYDTLPKFDYLLFIDADMAFPSEMVLDMMLLDEPVVGTIYPQRRLPISWAGSGDGSTHTERRANFMRCEGVGMGCTLIRRDVAQKFEAQMPELIDTRLKLHPAADMLKAAGCNRMIRAFEKMDLPERGVVSEDLSFCLRWGKMGGQVWAAIGYRISHVGPYDYAACYLEWAAEQEKLRDAQMQLQTSIAPELPVTPKGNGSELLVAAE